MLSSDKYFFYVVLNLVGSLGNLIYHPRIQHIIKTLKLFRKVTRSKRKGTRRFFNHEYKIPPLSE
jgi:hypothetical protein